jgi:RHS repeat-associated protein
VHSDWIGSSRYLSDSSGNSFPSMLRYDAFGGRSATGGTDGSHSSPSQFAGDWGYGTEFATGLEQGVGLQYVGSRYYHPAVGRVISQDPVGFVSGINMEDLASVYSAEDLYRRGVPRLGQALEALVQAWGSGARDEGILARQLRPDISAVDFAGMGTAGDYFGHLLAHLTAGNQERAKE